METNQQPIVISEEAREAALKLNPEYSKEWFENSICKCEHCAFKYKVSEEAREHRAYWIQLAIDSSTSKLREEICRKDWLLSEGSAKIQEQQTELTKLREGVERLNDWKVSAMRVFPDFQAIGQLLNVQLGEDVSSKIIPGIKDLQSQLTQAKEEVAERDGSIQYYKEQLTQAREELATEKVLVENRRLGHEIVQQQLHQSNSLVLELREAASKHIEACHTDPCDPTRGPIILCPANRTKEEIRIAVQNLEKVISIITPTSTTSIPREEYERVVNLLIRFHRISSGRMVAGDATVLEAGAAIETATQLLKGGQ